MKERLARIGGPLLGIALFCAAIWILGRELRHHQLADAVAHLREIPTSQLLVSLWLTALSYAVLTGYDTLAARYVGAKLRYPRIALVSFIAYVFSHNIGLAFFGGSAVRFRMLSSYGLKTSEIARIAVFNVLTFWLGFATLGGAAFIFEPARLPRAWLNPSANSLPIGILLWTVLALYLTYSATRRNRVVTVFGFEIAVPPLRLTLAQIGISVIDWSVAAAVLYALLPKEAGLTFPQLLSAYMLSIVLGLISNVPGGLGVFDTAIVMLLRRWLPADVLLGCVLAYRILYYLVPMAVALALFAGYELVQRRAAFARGRERVALWASELLPRVFAAITFAAGVILLISGATPAAPGRIDFLAPVVPLALLELSHFLGSVIGVGLLLLSRALFRRLDGAYFATLALLAGGALASLLKGFDWEEASILLVLFAALLPCRRFFYRHSSLFRQPFSLVWTVRVFLVLIGTGLVLLLSFRHKEFSRDLWWQFELSSHISRSLRAFVGAVVVATAGSLAALLRPARVKHAPASPEDLARVSPIVTEAAASSAHLALVGDKRILFSDDERAFLMYGAHRQSWIAMGDPVGAPEARRELAWRFRELADAEGDWVAFYEVSADDLPLYLDLGLSPRKIGEEARVALEGFSLAGGERKALRAAHNRVTREGGSFALLPPEQVPAHLDELQRISDDWLEAKHTREKRFSVGAFDRDYLARLPIAAVMREGRPLAFANVWLGGAKEELSIDLMRHASDAPPGVMDYLFAELMLWGQREGYRWFSLGMAPLSGLESHRFAPVWNRAGALLFRFGEHFYNFQGLRAFKEKFDPVWEPRYLAAPGGIALPFILSDIAALISGGVVGVVAR
ncbi:MAG TPA: bifunctional lysylphosphatidylglycerol flippase/synthetase MprF [Myxococcota bacterium]|nr:bifunctional lysylphosphatidylglycerol flippase/synthetase MprF [Myxococcota bacterium]